MWPWKLSARLKLNYLCTFFFSTLYILFLVVSINCVYNRVLICLSESKLHQTLFHWLFIAPQSDIDFTITSCQTCPTDKNSRLKVKPLRINDLEQAIFLQLCCLVGSNFSNLFSLVSTLNSIKAWKVKEGLFCYSWIKTWKRLKKPKTKQNNKNIYK